MRERDVYVGLGANLGSDGEILARFCHAVAAIARLEGNRVARVSPVYRSAPVGPVANQPPFLNAVVHCVAADAIAPATLLTSLLGIEAELGRQRGADALRYGPRSIDLDLLLWGRDRVTGDVPVALVVPHPALMQRAFVLRPLADLMGEEASAVDGGPTLRELLSAPHIAAQALEATDLALSVPLVS